MSGGLLRISGEKEGMSYKTGEGGGRGAKGWGFMCLTDGTSQGDDTVHQPAHLSAHRCHYHGLTGVWIIVEHWEINWIKWGWTQRDWAQAFIRIDDNRINGPVITTCTRHPRSQLEYSCVNHPSNRRCVLMELLLRCAGVSFTFTACFLSHAPKSLNSLPSSCFVGLALIMWNGLYTAEKIVIQWTLLSEACYFAVQFLGD